MTGPPWSSAARTATWFSAWGVDGGKAAVPSFSRVLQADGTELDVGKQSVYQPQRGDLLIVGGGGGGGYGNPLERDPEQVHGDILDTAWSRRSAAGSSMGWCSPMTARLTARQRLRCARTKGVRFKLRSKLNPDPNSSGGGRIPARAGRNGRPTGKKPLRSCADWCQKFPPQRPEDRPGKGVPARSGTLEPPHRHAAMSGACSSNWREEWA